MCWMFKVFLCAFYSQVYLDFLILDTNIEYISLNWIDYWWCDSM